jgi:hypothetical protein
MKKNSLVTGADSEATYVTWTFEPFIRPRKYAAGEVAYLRAFQKAMGGRVQVIDEYFLHEDGTRYPFYTLMRGIGGIREEDPRLVSSLMMWLGTSVGAGFRHQAEMLQTKQAFFTRGDAYLATWAIDNLKSAMRYSCQRDHLLNGVAAIFNRSATLRDSSVLDMAVHWLGSEDGQKYLKAAQNFHARFETRFKREHSRNRLG